MHLISTSLVCNSTTCDALGPVARGGVTRMRLCAISIRASVLCVCARVCSRMPVTTKA